MPTRIRWLLAALLVVTTLAYLPAIRAPFEFDDASAITTNESLRSLSPVVALRPPENTSVSGRPVVNYTFAINAAINRWLGVDERPNPYGANKTLGYHVVNLLLHIACGLLLFGTIRRTIASLPAAPVDANATAFVAASLWMLHPIHTEAVDYLVQRTELLVSVCYAGTLYASIRAWGAANERRRLAWQVAAVIVCLLGMGSKEVMITAPLMVVLYDRAFRLRSWREQFLSRGRVLFYVALIATAAWTIANVASNARFDTVGFHLGVSWYQYLYTQAWAVARYLRLMVWPSGLMLDYGTTPISSLAGVPGAILLTAFLVATIVAWRRVARWGWIAFLGAWFFLILAPSSSVVPIATEIAAERRVYLALASPILLVVIGATVLLDRYRLKASRLDRRAIATFGLVVLILAVLTFRRSALFRNPEALWRDAVHNAPKNARAYDNLAATMFFTDPPRLAEAAELYSTAVRLDSTYVHAWSGLASVAIDEGRFADAVPFLERALAIDSGYSVAFDQLGRVWLRTGRPDRALPYLEKYATAFPSENSLMSLGVALLQVGRYAEAATTLERVLQANPKRYEAMRLLGGALVESGRGTEAIPWLERLATGQQPTATGIGLLALAYAQAGRSNDALRGASAASADAGDNAGAHLLAGRAALLARDPASAEQYFSAAFALDPRNAEAATFLGIAQQQLGKSNAAQLQFRRALQIDPGYVPAQRALRGIR